MTPVDLPRAGSTNPSDPRYNPRLGGLIPIKVWLGGIEQKHVETYDIDEGFIVRAVPDEAGNLRVDGDEFMRERVLGVVTVALDCSDRG